MSTPDRAALDAMRGTTHHIRQYKAVLRAEIRRMPRKEAQATIAEILRNPPWEIHKMYVGFLLQWIHGIGPDKIEEILRDAGGGKFNDMIYRPMDQPYSNEYLTDAQRMRLADTLKDWRKTW